MLRLSKGFAWQKTTEILPLDKMTDVSKNVDYKKNMMEADYPLPTLVVIRFLFTFVLEMKNGSIILKEDLKNASDHHQQGAVFI